jgi:hypothetical protein
MSTEKCPTCGQLCTISWAGLELVVESGDERAATKFYHPVLPKHIIPEGDIEIYVTFPNDSSVGLQPVHYLLQAPDFRTDWTETEQELKTYIEEKRQEIQTIYQEYGGEYCHALFSFEDFHLSEDGPQAFTQKEH